MFISRLELVGFKSFAAETTLEFRPGVMAVVGPNGCGKTNIVDAIRWVLGEQRTSSLRAERMEAVIFTGTSKRKPLGMAEVTLTIENDKGLLPSIYSQVAITRRLFRSGESEYLINKTPSRLRDLADMFADTGLGSNAYSIIELSMVEGIIAGPPASRRQLFEEAAGVSRYKSRRAAAQRRLDETRDNLNRVEDIYKEVEKAYQSLKRQAARTKRYKEVEKALRCRLLADLADERLGILNRRKPLEERLQALEADYTRAESEAAVATADLLSLEGRELAVNDRIGRTQESLKRLDRREAELSGEAALIEQRRQYLTAELAQADERRAGLSNAAVTAETLLTAVKAEMETIGAELGGLNSRRSTGEEALRNLAGQLDEARRRLSELARAESEAEHALRAYRLQSSTVSAEKRQRIQRLEAAHSEHARVETAIREIDGQLQEKQRERVELKQNVVEAKDKFAAAEEKQAAIVRQLRDTQGAFAAASATLEAAKAALKAHREQPVNLATQPEAVRKVISSENLKTLAARLECKSEHKAALAAALSTALGAVDRPSIAAALSLAANIEKWRGTSLRYPTPTPASAVKVKLPPGENGCVAGAELVRNSDELGNFLRHRLEDVVLVPDLAVAAKHAAWARENHLRLVTPAGELLEPDGLMHAGVIHPETVRVGWQSMLKELEAAVESATKNRDRAQEDMERAVRGSSEADVALSEARAATIHAEDSAAAAARNFTALEDSHQRSQGRLRDLAGEIRALEGADDKSQLLPAEGDEQALENQLEEAGTAHHAAQVNLQAIETQHAEAASIQAHEASRAAEIGERSKGLERDSIRLDEEQQKSAAALARLDAGLEESRNELERVTQSAENVAAQQRLVKREYEDAAGQHETARQERDLIRKAREIANASLKQAEAAAKTASSEKAQSVEITIGLRERLKEVDRRLVEETDTPPDSVVENTVMDMEAQIAELGYAEFDAEKLRLRLQSLGPVNMLALGEFEEVEARHRFVGDQRLDLLKGVESLEETIERINVEARRLFREAFAAINENFQSTFRELFEGGEARITLEEGDPLEADIRIWATPSGKRLQSLSMLSGGEKALTAVALLFSIYRTRPTPFCILDEVDAPLDDANIIRFNRLVRKHTDRTQFMIVTHNKRTMEAADCLYGVTLGDDGTSHLVSVRLGNGNGSATKPAILTDEPVTEAVAEDATVETTSVVESGE